MFQVDNQYDLFEYFLTMSCNEQVTTYGCKQLFFLLVQGQAYGALHHYPISCASSVTTMLMVVYSVRAPMTDHLRDFVPTTEKYNVVQFFPVLEDRNKKDCHFFWVIFLFKLKLPCIFDTKSWHEHIPNV